MMMAMPAVKPMITGGGTKRIRSPSLRTPAASRMTPPISVARIRPSIAVHRDDAGDDDDEGAGRPADLDARAAQRRDDEAGDDGGDDALFGRRAAGDAERHGQRQRDDGDGQPGDGIGAQIIGGVAGAQEGDELGGKGFAGAHGRLADRLGAMRAASDTVVSGPGTPESTSPPAARWMALRMRG